MNKKKLPKVILSLNDEARPATPPDIPSAIGQQSSADHNGSGRALRHERNLQSRTPSTGEWRYLQSRDV